jgi:tRNA A37 threonylcarbamoyladenosine modification protein TsaB
MAIIDAGRGEVYVRIPPAEEFLLPAENARELAQSRNLRLITTDTRLATIFEDVRLLNFSSSELAARAGFRKLLREETVDVLALDANYIRKSEAEYLRKLQK